MQASLSEKTFERVECLLCGPTETRLLADRGMFGWPTYVSICKNCGLVFLNPRWVRPDYEYFYAVEYDQFYRFNESEAAEKEQRKARVVWERLQEFTPARFQSALDIGCGLGWCLHYMSTQLPGLAMAGIEPSDYCSDHFVKQIGGDLVSRDVDSEWHVSNQRRFDLIIFRHVLEHLLDPLAALKKVQQAVAPEGYVYIAVPDMMHPDGSLADFWYRCVHTYYYSEATLARIAIRAGLKPVVIRSENSELWGIFQKSETILEPANVSVYHEQVRAIQQYKRRRLFRRLLLIFSPEKTSQWIPKSFKNFIPKQFKQKFRQLVYRH